MSVVVSAVMACGGGTPPPRAPKPPDPKQIAADLHARMTEMAALVHRLRGACPELAVELRALFARLQVTVDEAERAAGDPAVARQLTSELRAYDESDAGLAAAISGDLAACKDDPAVRDVMTTMPTLPP